METEEDEQMYFKRQTPVVSKAVKFDYSNQDDRNSNRQEEEYPTVLDAYMNLRDQDRAKSVDKSLYMRRGEGRATPQPSGLIFPS